jgi:paraquat-inducible protein A
MASEIICHHCGQAHRDAPVAVGQHALCARCGSVLQRSAPPPDVALALTVTALVLAIPALQLPIAIVSKLGHERTSRLITGIVALWRAGMHLLAIWVALCGMIVPLALLGALGALLISARLGRGLSRRQNQWLLGAARAFERWSMPEVQVLAVLVAFVKIGKLVHVTVGPGLWCYGAMAVAILFAWRSAGSPEVHE